MPTPRPRYLSRITSPISTAPAAHSPPKPKPCIARRMKSCSKFCAKAQRNVKTEYQRMVICSIFTRPKRSASAPENQPPSDEISSVTVPISPASPFDIAHTVMIVGRMKLYICTSNASSDQPPKQAHIVLRSFAFRSRYQASMCFPPPLSLSASEADNRRRCHAEKPRSAMQKPNERGVLLIVDVQNDFCPGGALAVPEGDAIVPAVNRLARDFSHVVLTQDWHPPGHSSFASAHPGTQP